MVSTERVGVPPRWRAPSTWLALSWMVVAAPEVAQAATATQEPAASDTALDAELAEALAADANESADAAEEPASISASSGLYGDFYKTLPRISAVGVVAAAVHSVDEPTPLGGHNPAQDGFTLQQVEVAIQSTVDPYLKADLFLHFTELAVEIDAAYVQSLGLPYNLEVQAGKIFSPFGRFNHKHVEEWRFVDQPAVINRFFGGEPLAPLGVQVNWLAPAPFYLKVTGNLQNAIAAGGSGDEATFGRDGRFDFLYVGRLETFAPLSDTLSALVGFSLATGPSGQGVDNRTDLWGGDLFVRYKPVSGASTLELDWQTEVLARRRQFPGLLMVDWGVYSEVGLRVAQRWRLAGRGDWLDGDAVRAEVEPTRGRKRRWLRLSGAVSFEPTEFSRLRLQYSYDNPRWRDEDVIHAFYLQLEFSVGPHGAHPF